MQHLTINKDLIETDHQVVSTKNVHTQFVHTQDKSATRDV